VPKEGRQPCQPLFWDQGEEELWRGSSGSVQRKKRRPREGGATSRHCGDYLLKRGKKRAGGGGGVGGGVKNLLLFEKNSPGPHQWGEGGKTFSYIVVAKKSPKGVAFPLKREAAISVGRKKVEVKRSFREGRENGSGGKHIPVLRKREEVWPLRKKGCRLLRTNEDVENFPQKERGRALGETRFIL